MNHNNLYTPEELISELPLLKEHESFVLNTRAACNRIIKGEDDRLLVILGPCSIHNLEEALQYAGLLKEIYAQFQNNLLIIMRVYLEIPRTTFGWKGYINDPHLNGSFDIQYGIKTARKLLLDISALNIPIAFEFLNPLISNYLSDVISWGSIGSRTTESQTHRELASNLTMPVGFKNNTSGEIQTAINAMIAAGQGHVFPAISKPGAMSITQTKGNSNCHIILRGSHSHTNYKQANIISAAKKLTRNKLKPGLMIDFSHGNSHYNFAEQKHVASSICQQISEGSSLIMGVMLESNIKSGCQSINSSENLRPGVSVTDSCISWDETKEILQQLAKAVQEKRQLHSDNILLIKNRREIDKIDASISSLLNERMIQVQQVAAIKKQNNLSQNFYRPERERQILHTIIEQNDGPISDTGIEEIFQCILEVFLNAQSTP